VADLGDVFRRCAPCFARNRVNDVRRGTGRRDGRNGPGKGKIESRVPPPKRERRRGHLSVGLNDGRGELDDLAVFIGPATVLNHSLPSLRVADQKTDVFENLERRFMNPCHFARTQEFSG